MRNEDHGATLAGHFDGKGILHDLGATNRITAWAYGALEGAGARVWLAGAKEEALVALGEGWREALRNAG